MEEAKNLFQGQ